MNTEVISLIVYFLKLILQPVIIINCIKWDDENVKNVILEACKRIVQDRIGKIDTSSIR